MSGRRSRSRSPRRRRRSSHSPYTSRRRSDGDGSRQSQRGERHGRERVTSLSDRRAHDRYRSPGHNREERGESKPVNVDPPMDSHTTTRLDKSTDQENHQEKLGERLSRPERSGAKRLNSFVQREKNVLFPSGSNTVNRGRDRVRDRSWREERGRAEGRGQASRRSEGILSRESMEENGEKGERRQSETFVEDPQEVPRAGYYFEHDDRDAPQPSQIRTNSDSRRQERRHQHSPERWTRGRDSRDRSRSSYRGRDSWDRPSDSRRVRDWGRDPPKERLGNRSDRSDRRHSGGRDRSPVHDTCMHRRHSGGRDRSPVQWKHDLFETVDQPPEPEEPTQQEAVQRHSGGRDRSPVQWQHDLFETVDQPPEPEEPTQQEAVPKWKSKTLEEGIEDFDIDDLLLMDNPIVKMELDV